MSTYISDLVSTGRLPMLSGPSQKMRHNDLQAGILLSPLCGWASFRDLFLGAVRVSYGIVGFRIEPIGRVTETTDDESTFDSALSANGDYAGEVAHSDRIPRSDSRLGGLIDRYWDKDTAEWAKDMNHRCFDALLCADEGSHTVLTDGTQFDLPLAYGRNYGEARMTLVEDAEKERVLRTIWSMDWPWLPPEMERLGKIHDERPTNDLAAMLSGTYIATSHNSHLDESAEVHSSLRPACNADEIRHGPLRDAWIASLGMVARQLIPSRRLAALVLDQPNSILVTRYKNDNMIGSQLAPYMDRRLDGSYVTVSDSELFPVMLKMLMRGDPRLWLAGGENAMSLRKELETLAVVNAL